MKIISIIILSSFGFTLISCHRKHMIQTAGINNSGYEEVVTATPNSCVVIAEVISILPVDASLKDSWCGKFPCDAKLKVIEIKQCGSASTGNIETEKELMVHFVFTTATSSEVGNDVPVFLPGVKAGNKILTTLNFHPALGGGMDYSVYSYKVL